VPFDDLTSDGSLPVRSLSEQLRNLEARLGHDTELSLPRVGRRTTLPTHLGRPIGLTRLEGFPRIARLDAEANVPPKPPLSRAAALRRSATVVGVGLLLLATTAIVPPLFLRYPIPAATQAPPPDQVLIPQRTERFALSAQDLRLAGPAPDSYSPPTKPAQTRAAPVWAVIAPESAPSGSTARYEPTAAEGEAVPDLMVLPPPRTR
jgi:hypothetical protein